jgi:hypothetical protein
MILTIACWHACSSLRKAKPMRNPPEGRRTVANKLVSTMRNRVASLPDVNATIGTADDESSQLQTEGTVRYLRERWGGHYDFRIVPHPYNFTHAIGVFHRDTPHLAAYVAAGPLSALPRDRY